MADSYTRLFEQSIFPLLDRLNGTSMAEKLDGLLASEHLDPAEIRHRQEAAIATAVARAKSSSRFYSHLWKNGTPVEPLVFPVYVLPRKLDTSKSLIPLSRSFLVTIGRRSSASNSDGGPGVLFFQSWL
jgi:hypothetical protein